MTTEKTKSDPVSIQEPPLASNECSTSPLVELPHSIDPSSSSEKLEKTEQLLKEPSETSSINPLQVSRAAQPPYFWESADFRKVHPLQTRPHAVYDFYGPSEVRKDLGLTLYYGLYHRDLHGYVQIGDLVKIEGYTDLLPVAQIAQMHNNNKVWIYCYHEHEKCVLHLHSATSLHFNEKTHQAAEDTVKDDVLFEKIKDAIREWECIIAQVYATNKRPTKPTKHSLEPDPNSQVSEKPQSNEQKPKKKLLQATPYDLRTAEGSSSSQFDEGEPDLKNFLHDMQQQLKRQGDCLERIERKFQAMDKRSKHDSTPPSQVSVPFSSPHPIQPPLSAQPSLTHLPSNPTSLLLIQNQLLSELHRTQLELLHHKVDVHHDISENELRETQNSINRHLEYLYHMYQ